jgi:hypothetical protein
MLCRLIGAIGSVGILKGVGVSTDYNSVKYQSDNTRMHEMINGVHVLTDIQILLNGGGGVVYLHNLTSSALLGRLISPITIIRWGDRNNYDSVII